MADDIVNDMLERVRQACPDITENQLSVIEHQIRNDWGGNETYIQKKRISTAQKQKAVDEYIGGRPVEVIRKKTGVSRSTLYRHLKK